jgi:hypothetical protein
LKRRETVYTLVKYRKKGESSNEAGEETNGSVFQMCKYPSEPCGTINVKQVHIVVRRYDM